VSEGLPSEAYKTSNPPASAGGFLLERFDLLDNYRPWVAPLFQPQRIVLANIGHWIHITTWINFWGAGQVGEENLISRSLTVLNNSPHNGRTRYSPELRRTIHVHLPAAVSRT